MASPRRSPIPIWIDKKALDDVGIGTDTPVTINLAGITLRSGLKIMLKELELTYVISDEVLKITTPKRPTTSCSRRSIPWPTWSCRSSAAWAWAA